jgi:hypothetical protein
MKSQTNLIIIFGNTKNAYRSSFNLTIGDVRFDAVRNGSFRGDYDNKYFSSTYEFANALIKTLNNPNAVVIGAEETYVEFTTIPHSPEAVWTRRDLMNVLPIGRATQANVLRLVHGAILYK